MKRIYLWIILAVAVMALVIVASLLISGNAGTAAFRGRVEAIGDCSGINDPPGGFTVKKTKDDCKALYERYQSDTQPPVTDVYKWCVPSGVCFYPPNF